MDTNTSGISWGAVIGGAIVTAAMSLMLLVLGTGIGLSALSPWASANVSDTAIGATAVGWLVLSQLIAASMGGYVAGRLRMHWVDVHADEVYFRDTAHGFLAWAVALVIAAAFLTSAATAIAGGAAAAGTTAVATEATRKAAAHLSYWTFFALLVGAFSASVSAILGAHHKQHLKPMSMTDDVRRIRVS